MPTPGVPTPPIHEAAERRDWPAYFERIEGRPPRETLLTALEAFAKDDADAPDRPERAAVDLGCGSGIDTAELLTRGWRVHAFDGHAGGIERLLARPACVEHAARLCARVQDFAEIEPPACDLLNASFSLPFCPPERFGALWARISDALAPGARFCGQLFGDRDSWSIIEDRTHLRREEALALFDGFVLESFREEDRPGTSAPGGGGAHKHWHVFHIVARRRG